MNGTKKGTRTAEGLLGLVVAMAIAVGVALPAFAIQGGGGAVALMERCGSTRPIPCKVVGDASGLTPLQKQAAQSAELVNALQAQEAVKQVALAKQSAQAQALVEALNSGALTYPMSVPAGQGPGSNPIGNPSTWGYQVVIAVLSALLLFAVAFGAISYRRRPTPTALA